MGQFAYPVPRLVEYSRLKFFSSAVFEGIPIVEASNDLGLYHDHFTYLPILEVRLSLELFFHKILNIFERVVLCVLQARR